MSICKALAKPTPLTFRAGLNPSSCAPKSNAGCISPAPGAAPGTLQVFAGCRGSWGSLCPQLVTPAHLAWPRNTPRRARSLETVRQEGQRHQPSVQPGSPCRPRTPQRARRTSLDGEASTLRRDCSRPSPLRPARREDRLRLCSESPVAPRCSNIRRTCASLRCLNPARGARDKERGPRNPRNELLGTGVAGNGSAGHRRGLQRTLHRRRAWPRRKPSIRAEDAVGALQPPGPAPRAAPVSCSPPRRSQLCGYLLHDQLTESSLRLALLLRGRDVFSIHRSKSKGGRE